jgi:CubicO group peptidase (beta-lactamase class C family)
MIGEPIGARKLANPADEARLIATIRVLGVSSMRNCSGVYRWALALAMCWTGMTLGQEPMQGVPPSRESQATFQNYRQAPFNRWAFRNMGAPTHVVLMPRAGEIHQFDRGDIPDWDSDTFDRLFRENHADGVVVIRGNSILHERYFGGFGPHDHHIWFSMTKSLVSAALGKLLLEGKVDLESSPADLIPELADSGFARTTVQQVLNHSSAIDFQENYTDRKSDFLRYYAPALGMAWVPGAADARPDDTRIYGVHDFLANFIKPDKRLEPGEAFDYNSANADVIGWIAARVSGQTLDAYLTDTIWSHLGTEHDAAIVVDRAYMPVATGGMNSTLRDAARFGMMMRDQGRFNGRQVVPAVWVDRILRLSRQLVANMAANRKYAGDPWIAYHNMWWVLSANPGEYCAVGIHGQVIYINRSADTVMAWFSSQPAASSANNPNFHAKLAAARALASRLQESGQ